MNAQYDLHETRSYEFIIYLTISIRVISKANMVQDVEKALLWNVYVWMWMGEVNRRSKVELNLLL